MLERRLSATRKKRMPNPRNIDADARQFAKFG
jgi:hypothetical protein